MTRLEIFILTLTFFLCSRTLISDSLGQTPKNRPADATTRPYLTIENPKINPLTDLHKRLIIRSAIKIVMKSQKYQLIFSSPRSFEDAKFEFHKLELMGRSKKFGKNKKGYELNYQLIDARTKAVIKEVKLSYIEKRHLVYKSKLLLYELFFGKDKAIELEEELKKEAEKELIKAGNKSGNLQSISSLINEQTKLLKNKKDQENKKKKSIKSSELDLDLLKKNIKKKQKIAEFEAPDLDLRKEKLDTKVNPPKNFKLYSDYSFSLGFSDMIVLSKSVIDVENKVKMVGVNIEAAIQLEENSWNRIHLGFGIHKITSSNLFGISAPKTFDILYDFGARTSFIRFQGGLEFETQSFANLGTAGEGIKAWDGTFLWFKVGAVVEFMLSKKKIGIGGFYYSPFFGSSNFNTDGAEITLTGSKYAVYGIAQVWEGWHAKFSYNKANITSQGLSSLENQHTVLTFSAVYQ